MTTPLFLKPDNFGTFDYTYVPEGGSCPPGQLPSAVECIIAPCPDLCRAAESMDLSGEALVSNLPATLEDVQRQQAAEQGNAQGILAGIPRWLLLAVLAIPVLPLLAAWGKAR